MKIEVEALSPVEKKVTVEVDPERVAKELDVAYASLGRRVKLRGFRAYPGRNRAIFSKLGLKPGDLVTAINGTMLDDPQHSQEVFNTIQTSDHVTVTIERGGQKQDITLNIAQVAAQATRDLEGDTAPTSSLPGGMPPPGAAPTNNSNENPNDQ